VFYVINTHILRIAYKLKHIKAIKTVVHTIKRRAMQIYERTYET